MYKYVKMQFRNMYKCKVEICELAMWKYVKMQGRNMCTCNVEI